MTQKIKFFLSGIFFFSCVLLSSAQEITTVKGLIRDKEGNPIPGVTILVKGNKNGYGVVSDLEGNYSIKAKVGDVLLYSHIGLSPKEYKVFRKDAKMDLVMEDLTNRLDDVVVMGYGSAKKIGTTVGSVVKVSSEAFVDKPVVNVLDALQGKVSGLKVLSTSGEPSDIGTIQLHGASSLFGDSNPLIILDGSPVSTSAMLYLNPQDFESVTVLKDASATSIYGTRAANGVIYIKTKKGVLGEKGTVTISSQYGFSSLANRDFFNSMMNREQYRQYMLEFGVNPTALDDFYATNTHNTRWDEIFFRDKRPTIQLNLSTNGGTEKTTYYISGGYNKQQGLMHRSSFERYSFRSNLTSQVKDWFKLGLNLSAGYMEYEFNPATGKSVSSGSLSNSSYDMLLPPYLSPYDEKGNISQFMGGERVNPFYVAEKNPFVTKSLNLAPIAFAEIRPIENLTFTTQIGLQYNNSRQFERSLPSYEEAPGKKNTNIFTRKVVNENTSSTITNTLEWKLNSDNVHHFTALVGQEFLQMDRDNISAEVKNLIFDGATQLKHGTDPRVSDFRTRTTFNSYFTRLDYNYKSRYIVDVSARRDGSSRFGENNRYANFWSLGAMWQLKGENFLKNVRWIDGLSAKFSTGVSGNANVLSDYMYLPKVSVGNITYSGLKGYNLSDLGNPDLQWQKQRKHTFAINADLFGRLQFSVDLYKRIISDMIVSVEIPGITGFNSYTTNDMEFMNKGVDVSLSYTPIKDKKGYLTIWSSFNYNREEIVKLPQGANSYYRDNGDFIYEVGKPSTYFYPIFHQINPQNGAPEWYVRTAEPVVKNTNPNNVTTTFNSVALKQNTGILKNPPINGGFGFDGAYKDFSFQLYFSYSLGKYMINQDRYFTENPVNSAFLGADNQNVAIFDYWKQTGDITRFPDPKKGYRFTQYDSRLIEDASYLRLRGLTVNYTLPQKYVKQIGAFKTISIFTSMSNLLTFTKFSGADPEIDAPASFGVNPSTRETTFGINLKF